MERATRAVLIGAGNVAWHLAPALQAAGGVRWLQVFSRTEERARAMAGRLGGIAFTGRVEEILPEADFYCFAVSDHAVGELASRLRFPGKTVAHLSGSVPMDALKPVSEHCGVMYFFQTFSREAPCPDLRQTPVCIEASDPSTFRELQRLAGSVSGRVLPMSSAQRSVLHIGGVFACNYVNFMYSIACDLMEEAGIDFGLLQPLILQTAKKSGSGSPWKGQTGPAVRGDREILRRQEAYLSSTPQGRKHVELYRLLAQAIAERRRSEQAVLPIGSTGNPQEKQAGDKERAKQDERVRNEERMK